LNETMRLFEEILLTGTYYCLGYSTQVNNW